MNNPATESKHMPEYELTDGQIEAAAKMMAHCLFYPWEHMPEKGRQNMRDDAQAIVLAALHQSTGGADHG